LVTQHAYAWVSPPNENYVMVQYNIKNIGASTLNNLYAGLFADWDIPAYANNKCSTDMARRMGYIWSTDSAGLWGGMKLLSHTGGFNHYAIDNISTASGVLMTDGYNDAEKFTTLSTTRTDAGMGSATGNDVISVVSSGGVTLAPGDSVEVTFALIAGESLASIQASADAAQWKYDSAFVGIQPIGKAIANELSQSYPNPADRELKIDFSLKENNYSELCIYNLVGEKVKSIVREKLAAGKYTVHVDVSDLPSGQYLYRLVSGNYSKTLPLNVVHQ
jgi:serine protease